MSKTIVLDAGHSMTTAGKRTDRFTDGTKSALTGKDFMHEYEFNKAVVVYLKAELERNGFIVKTTLPKDDNYDVPLAERCRISDAAKADLFVSIHANALSGTWAKGGKGIETFSFKTGASVKFADLVQRNLIKATGLANRGRKDGSWLFVIKNQKAPSILVEAGFMDNLAEAKLLLSDTYRRTVAKEVAKAICEGFAVAYKEAVKPPSKPVQAPPLSPAKAIYRVKKDGVQVAAFSSKDNALVHANKLLKEGAKTVSIELV